MCRTFTRCPGGKAPIVLQGNSANGVQVGKHDWLRNQRRRGATSFEPYPHCGVFLWSPALNWRRRGRATRNVNPMRNALILTYSAQTACASPDIERTATFRRAMLAYVSTIHNIYQALWADQNVGLTRERPAAYLVRTLATETAVRLKAFF